MKKLLLFILLTPFIGISQNVESFEDAMYLHERGMELVDDDPEKALDFIGQSHDFFKNAPNSDEKIDNYWWLGIAYSSNGQYDSAKTYYKTAMSHALNLNDFGKAIDIQNSYVLRCLIVAGGDFDAELKLALEIKEKAKNLDDPLILLKANRLLIDMYWDMLEFRDQIVDLAIENDELSREMGDSSLIRYSLFDLAFAYSRIEKFQMSANTYKQVIEMQLATNDLFVSASYNNMASQFKQMGQLDSAIYYYELGLKYSLLQSRWDGVAASKMYLGEIHLAKREWSEALASCEEALQIFRENNILRRQEGCVECIKNAYEGMGNKAAAYDYLKLMYALEDSLLSDAAVRDLQVMESEFKLRLDAITDSLDYAYKHELKEAEVVEQRKRSNLLWIGLGLTALFAFFILNRFRITRQQKKVIESQKLEVEQAHEELTVKNKEILDSIVYAKRIQSAILPPDDAFEQLLPNSFVLYKPKDIVAGDFYWLEKLGDEILFAAADCTGHGVPGAMVSVVCNNGLNRSVREHHLNVPGAILDKTREIVLKEFDKSKEEVKDGMDIALCALNMGTSATLGVHDERTSSGVEKPVLLKYAGAHNSLWIIRSGSKEIEEHKADKQPIGKFKEAAPFKTHEVELQKGDTVYIFTDGYADQFGGDKGKKMKAANFKTLLIKVSALPMKQQKDELDVAFEEWKGSLEQLDDVCVIGVRI